MQRLCDLHTHSIYSDGSCTPEELLNLAQQAGLSAVALCDHNTVDGLPSFLSAATNTKVEAIAGAEFSVDLEGTELHLLGLEIPVTYFSQISEQMREGMKRKEISNLELIESLGRAGYSLDYKAIKDQTPNGKVNRAHIAMELTRRGYTGSVQEAFATLLSPAAGHYIEPKRLTVWEMLDVLCSMGAIPVLAHPFLNLSEERLKELLPQAARRGLRGMECQYSLYDETTTQTAMQMADAYGLKYSGGSDFHGTAKPDIRIGVGKGNLQIPYQWLIDLHRA
ncbi:MAG: PHP domain-containing protein [Clostridia bacterium]|nr:PHP domain-containing protein [Clostridia bacterium]